MAADLLQGTIQAYGCHLHIMWPRTRLPEGPSFPSYIYSIHQSGETENVLRRYIWRGPEKGPCLWWFLPFGTLFLWRLDWPLFDLFCKTLKP